MACEHPLLTTTAQYEGIEYDRANIKDGRKIQKALLDRKSQSVILDSSKGILSRCDDNLVPAYAQRDPEIPKKRRTIKLSLLKKLLHKHDELDLDTATVPLRTRKQLKRAQKDEYRSALQGSKDDPTVNEREVLRQLHKHEQEDKTRLAQLRVTPTLRDRFRLTVRRKKTASPDMDVQTDSASVASALISVPNVHRSSPKTSVQPFYEPDHIPMAAELPGMDEEEIRNSFLQPNSTVAAVHDQGGFSDPPPTFRSYSPQLPPIPNLDLVVGSGPLSENEARARPKQMQCDNCGDSIRMDSFHYVCDVCDVEEKLYCARCMENGCVCRHQLREQTRNVQRHPSNTRGVLPFSTMSAAGEPVSEPLPPASAYHGNVVPAAANNTTCIRPQSSALQTDIKPESFTNTSPTEIWKDIENQRKQQEIVAREQQVVIREREALLREREALTASRERDAALVQQLHAVAALHREQQQQHFVEAGSQFSPGGPGRYPSTASRTRFPGIDLHPKDSNLRSHAGSTKRKATEAPHSRSSSASSRKTAHHVRGNVKENLQDKCSDLEDNESSESCSPKRAKHEVQDDAVILRPFACPFVKHDPAHYSSLEESSGLQGCVLGNHSSISRLKQHLKRRHHAPDTYCTRCYTVLPDEAGLDKHSRRGCEHRAWPWPTKLSTRQQNMIHVKRPRKNVEEQWYEIYQTIFPSDPLPDSPYRDQKSADQAMLEQFINRFSAKLDVAVKSGERDWLYPPQNRQFLRSELTQTMLELVRDSVSGRPLASLQNSPFVAADPGDELDQIEDRVFQAEPEIGLPDCSHGGRRIAPEKLPLPRPVLKVTTTGMRKASRSTSRTHSNDHSANSGILPNTFAKMSFPADDLNLDQCDPSNGSWLSGDDKAIGNLRPYAAEAEPSSATSNTSRKSVSFANPPEHLQSKQKDASPLLANPWTDLNNPVYDNMHLPNLDDFATAPWSIEAPFFMSGQPPACQQVTHAWDHINAPNKGYSTSIADSGYHTGMISHAPSLSSMQSQHLQHYSTPSLDPAPSIDPRFLYLNPRNTNDIT